MPEAVGRQMAAAHAAFADALRTLHFPDARLQRNARHVHLALIAIDVIYTWLQVVSHGIFLPLATLFT